MFRATASCSRNGHKCHKLGVKFSVRSEIEKGLRSGQHILTQLFSEYPPDKNVPSMVFAVRQLQNYLLIENSYKIARMVVDISSFCDRMSGNLSP